MNIYIYIYYAKKYIVFDKYVITITNHRYDYIHYTSLTYFHQFVKHEIGSH